MAILCQYTAGFMLRHRWAQQVKNVLSRILLCRTAPLGGHKYECPQCHEQTHLYNSCADRHCPQCAGAKRANWTDSTANLLLPRVDYFQIIFTLPDYLSGLALGNREKVYSLLFRSAWQALDETLRQTGKFQPAALMVLHTWNQQLDHHPHVHTLVPGGGPSLEGDQWITSQHPTQIRRKKPYLVDNGLLGTCFRKKFIQGLRRLFKRGELKLEGVWSDLLVPAERDAWIEPLEAMDWNVFVEGPPNGKSDPKHVIKYLARYMTGGPISDSRLISHEGDEITFWARSKDKRSGNQSEPFTLKCIEFVRRWAMHILPKGFTKTRRYGGFSGAKCDAYLQRCRELLHSPEAAPEVDAPKSERESTSPTCPRCQCELDLLQFTKRPSWRVVFERLYTAPNTYSPQWHTQHLPASHTSPSPRPWQPDG